MNAEPLQRKSPAPANSRRRQIMFTREFLTGPLRGHRTQSSCDVDELPNLLLATKQNFAQDPASGDFYWVTSVEAA